MKQYKIQKSIGGSEMQRKMPVIISVVGESGTGKDTLVNLLVKKHPELFHKPKNYTTRPVRPGEEGNEQHEHISREHMLELLTTKHAIAPGDFGEDFYCMFLEDLKADRVNIKAMSPAGVRLIGLLGRGKVEHYVVQVHCELTDVVDRLTATFVKEHPELEPLVTAGFMKHLEDRLSRSNIQYKAFLTSKDYIFTVDTGPGKEDDYNLSVKNITYFAAETLKHNG